VLAPIAAVCYVCMKVRAVNSNEQVGRTCEAAVLADDATIIVYDVQRPRRQAPLTVDADETANVVDGVVADLMNEIT